MKRLIGTANEYDKRVIKENQDHEGSKKQQNHHQYPYWRTVEQLKSIKYLGAELTEDVIKKSELK